MQENEYMEYITAKGIPRLVDRMVEECCKNRPPHPVSFLQRFLEDYGRNPGGAGKEKHHLLSHGGLQEHLAPPTPVHAACQAAADAFNDASTGKDARVVVLGAGPGAAACEGAEVAARTLLGNELRVADCGWCTPAPCVSFEVRRRRDVAGGIFVREDGELQLYSEDGVPIDPSSPPTVSCCRSISDLPAARYEGFCAATPATLLYVDALDSAFMLSGGGMEGVKVVIDCGHGACGPVAREVFVQRLGLDDAVLLREVPRLDLGGEGGGQGVQDVLPLRPSEKLCMLNASGSACRLVAVWSRDGRRACVGGGGVWAEASELFALYCCSASSGDLRRLLDDRPQFQQGGCIPHTESLAFSNSIDLIAPSLRNSVVVHTLPGQSHLASMGNWGVDGDRVGNPLHMEADGIFATLLAYRLLAADPDASLRSLLESMWSRHGRVYHTVGLLHGIPGGDISASPVAAVPGAERLSPSQSVTLQQHVWTFPLPDGAVAKVHCPNGSEAAVVSLSKHSRDYTQPLSAALAEAKVAFDALLKECGWEGDPVSSYSDEGLPEVCTSEAE